MKVKEVLVVFVDEKRSIKFEVSEDPSKDKSSLLRAARTTYEGDVANITYVILAILLSCLAT